MSKYTTMIIIAIILAILAVISTYLLVLPQPINTPLNNAVSISNFSDCVLAGQPVLESYPRQCQANGQTFVENIGNTLEKVELIRLEQPQPNQTLSSPLEIKGQARGTWFFEASFPIKLLDANDQQIAVAIAQAQGEWMTENWVPFTAKLEFNKPTTNNGYLILQKDNPSGLAENDDQLSIPIKF